MFFCHIVGVVPHWSSCNLFFYDDVVGDFSCAAKVFNLIRVLLWYCWWMFISFNVVDVPFFCLRCRWSNWRMSMGHLCSFSTSNGWHKQSSNLYCCGGGGSRNLDVSPIFHYEDKSVLRSTKTTKNQRKQFWSCPKCKVKYMKPMLFVSLFFKRDHVDFFF